MPSAAVARLHFLRDSIHVAMMPAVYGTNVQPNAVESVGQQLVSGTFKFAAAVTAIGQTAQFRQIILGKFASCQQLAARRVMRV